MISMHIVFLRLLTYSKTFSETISTCLSINIDSKCQRPNDWEKINRDLDIFLSMRLIFQILKKIQALTGISKKCILMMVCDNFNLRLRWPIAPKYHTVKRFKKKHFTIPTYTSDYPIEL